MQEYLLTTRMLNPFRWIRATGLLLQLVYLFWIEQTSSLELWIILVIQVTLLLVSVYSWGESFGSKALFANLIIDSLLLSGFIYLSGGISNPLISLLLLPIATASLILHWKYAIGIVLFCIGSYSLMLIIRPHDHANMAFNSHLIGMWLVFVISAGLLFFVVSQLVSEGRLQQKQIQIHKQKQLRNEHIMALGLAAANTAHELNTPLSSLSVMVDDMLESNTASVATNKDLHIMEQQILRCQKITQQMIEQVQSGNVSKIEIGLNDFARQLIRDFRLLRPEIIIKPSLTSSKASINFQTGLSSALLNLLDNAAKASIEKKSNKVLLITQVIDGFAQIKIIDYGQGVESHVKDSYGISAQKSAKGLGVGLMLSSATIETLGGSLIISKHQEFGSEVVVQLPVSIKYKQYS